MVASGSYASAARWAYCSACAKSNGVGGREGVVFLPHADTPARTTAKRANVTADRRARNRAGGIMRVRSFRERWQVAGQSFYPHPSEKSTLGFFSRLDASAEANSWDVNSEQH